MKYLSFLAIIFICGLCYSQSPVSSGRVTYKETFKDGGVFNYNLYFNNNNSSYIYENLSDTIVKFTSPSKLVFDFSRTTNNLIQYSEIADEKYIVIDTLRILNWNLDFEEEKTINKYHCNKATVNLRGIDFTVWYATEIPVNYGPWKFRGLPGLILQVYDEGLNFEIIAEEISLNATNAAVVEKKVNSLFKKVNISWKNFVEKYRNQDIEISRRLSALIGRNETIKVTSSGFKKEKL
jgi:GLPGLI family protein